MNNNNSLTLFDQLATEIIFEIFDYVSSNDIIYTFFYFNQRLNSIILENQHLLNNFQSPTTKNQHFWQNILPIIASHIQCLIKVTTDFYFSLDLFSNLKRLIIFCSLPISCEQLNFLFEYKQFNKLISFEIKNEIFHNETSVSGHKILLKNIFHHENSLKKFECLSESILYNSREIHHLTINRNIQSLSLKSIHSIDVFILLQYTPNLKNFNLIVTSFYHNNQLNKTIDLSHIQLKTFTFTLSNDIEYAEIYETNIFSLINLIRQFSLTLIYLSLNLSRVCICETNTFQINGILFEQHLLESMRKLKQFHFYLKLNQLPTDVENVLVTFKNRFWFDRKWFIGMHGTYIYTLPFHYNKFEYFTDFDSIQSSNSEVLNSFWTGYHVKSIGLSDLDRNSMEQLKRKMPNLISTEFTSYFELIPEYETIDITLDSVNTLHCRCESMEDIKPWLIYNLPNVKHLILSCFDFLKHREDGLIANYDHFTKIQSVEIKVLSKTRDDAWMYGISFIRKILGIFQCSKSFIFQFYLIRYHSSNIPIVNLQKIYLDSKFNPILEYYQMKQSYNYLQLIKKE